ncbi:MAG: IS4 family transposase [Methanosarcinales archaeon]|nr:IS4 family transposase [Methanosarcinales archaeon]
MDNHTKQTDPSVEYLRQMFPEEFLRNLAQKTGFIKRIRKIDPVTFFWVLTLGFGVDFLRSIRAFERRYETEANIKLSDGALYDRFTPELVEFLRECVLHAIEFQVQQQSRVLGEKLNGFKDIIIQDSSIIRLHESLANLWPATRSTRVAAGIKVSCIVSVVADGVKSVKLFPERTSEVKTLNIGPWVRDRIFLIDLGFFKYGVFDRIDKYQGSFVSRLKSNANPTIVQLNRTCRGNSISVEGKKLKDVLPHLKRGILDVMVEVKFKRRKYRGKRTTVTKLFRVVAVLNEETGDYHIYMTNIPVTRLSAEDIASLYGARWEIEMVFKELKSYYRMDQINSKNTDIIKSLVWVSILTLMCSRRVLQLIRNVDPEKANRYTHLRWAKVFGENAHQLLKEVLESMGMHLDMSVLYDIYLNHGCDPNIRRERLMEGWVA